MLLNFSNHPSHTWNEKQLLKAFELFESVTDLEFPHIDPHFSYDDIDKLSTKYVDIILSKRPKVVHIMGELTFTYKVVLKLQMEGMLCIGSTTHRIATEEDGYKFSKFEFVQFRGY
jgi:hypothetical protein